ncbi:hypothetical protein [Halobacillus litoralis]|uniref:Uncharacterized protein n=1 Tax=Halobacillus litoralis TaxID=45668 RepID=A0A410MC57_9BACI|nr:hypothetical protein [Halobacillus litoralis]QAS52236.1 hypothetical protein HLI_08330 [Halobacillus litoralis]
MDVLKGRNTIRYHYKDGHLYLYGSDHTFKVKATEEDYLTIHFMISELRNGVVKEEALVKFRRYSSLLTFLIEKDFVYTISKEVLKNHKEHEYFTWLEEVSPNNEQSLQMLERLAFVCPIEDDAAYSFMKKCEDNELNCRMDQQAVSYQVWKDDKCLASYLPYVNEQEEVVVAPSSSAYRTPVDHTLIAGKLLSPFLFYSLVTAVFKDYPSVFFIKKDLEVTKKEYFQLQRADSYVKKSKNKDPMKSLNALEKFLQTYQSSILSFNSDERYEKYLQLPIQIFTVQRTGKWEESDLFVADIDYERLSKFVVEVVFIEALQKEYHERLSLFEGGQLIHRTKALVKDDEGKLRKIARETIPEYEMFQRLLEKEQLDVTFYYHRTASGELAFYIRDEYTRSTYRYEYALMNKEYLPLLIYTWISAFKNGISVEKTGFQSVSISSEFKEAEDSFDFISSGDKRANDSNQHTNINPILDDLGYGYEVMEG